jgi:hypothetical protein
MPKPTKPGFGGFVTMLLGFSRKTSVEGQLRRVGWRVIQSQGYRAGLGYGDTVA